MFRQCYFLVLSWQTGMCFLQLKFRGVLRSCLRLNTHFYRTLPSPPLPRAVENSTISTLRQRYKNNPTWGASRGRKSPPFFCQHGLPPARLVMGCGAQQTVMIQIIHKFGCFMLLFTARGANVGVIFASFELFCAARARGWVG